MRVSILVALQRIGGDVAGTKGRRRYSHALVSGGVIGGGRGVNWRGACAHSAERRAPSALRFGALRRAQSKDAVNSTRRHGALPPLRPLAFFALRPLPSPPRSGTEKPSSDPGPPSPSSLSLPRGPNYPRDTTPTRSHAHELNSPPVRLLPHAHPQLHTRVCAPDSIALAERHRLPRRPHRPRLPPCRLLHRSPRACTARVGRSTSPRRCPPGCSSSSAASARPSTREGNKSGTSGEE